MRLSVVAVVGCMLAFGGAVFAQNNLSSIEALQAEIASGRSSKATKVNPTSDEEG